MAPIIASFGWRMAFHAMGILEIIFVAIYAFVLRPTHKKTIEARKTAVAAVPWRKILTNGMLWQFFLIVFGLSVITKGLDFWILPYLLQARHLNLAGISWLVPLPSIAAGLGAIASGWILTHYFTGRENLLLASLATTLFVFGMYQCPSLAAVITFEIATYFFKSVVFTGTFAFFAELVGKKEYGSSVRIVNFGGQLAGFVAPIVIGALVTAFKGSYSIAFLFLVGAAAVAFLSSLSLNTRKLAAQKLVVGGECK
ncbi:MFS transporter [Bombilactobacillus apium]|uniref:MFS transporter n=1 Tax=Bombilactobacillus apium TaxID=2675299 RepID=UPI00226BDB95|nr:MFS transporter [Bombilactobacillus apium]